MQALSGVQVLAGADGIELRATDMEIGLRVPLAGEVVREGAVVLPARLLVDVVRSLPGDSVSLELRSAEQDVEIIAGAATFHIRTLRLEDFPPFPEPEQDGRVQVPAAAFVATVAKVARSASRDETRPVLTGILVSATGDELRMVATDSYRLSVEGDEARVAARRRVRGERARARAAGAEPDRRRRRGGRAERRGAHEPGHLRGRRRRPLLAADRRPVPQPPPAAARRLRARAPARRAAEITDVVRRISLLAQKNAPLRLAFSEGELTVSARTPDVGEARETLPVPFQGEPLEIGFNPEFLRDGLEAVDSGDVLLRLISPLRPGADRGGRRQRVRLPPDADPPERVGAP